VQSERNETHNGSEGESVFECPPDAKLVSVTIEPTNRPNEVMLLWMFLMLSGAVNGLARLTVESAKSFVTPVVGRTVKLA
jgi:hypothetical protein